MGVASSETDFKQLPADVRRALRQSNLTKHFWFYAWLDAEDKMNKLPWSKDGNTSSYMKWYDRPAHVKNLYPFGCLGYTLRPPRDRTQHGRIATMVTTKVAAEALESPLWTPHGTVW